jgi:hypothetical protein
MEFAFIVKIILNPLNIYNFWEYFSNIFSSLDDMRQIALRNYREIRNAHEKN